MIEKETNKQREKERKKDKSQRKKKKKERKKRFVETVENIMYYIAEMSCWCLFLNKSQKPLIVILAWVRKKVDKNTHL